ncbi:hypothetical protein QBC37DRAFT_447729 [Rhypophila decipiens]|uniref:C3H1-type domain-containing protein n=1 Tax=Rhypophila decipiens TaxID=261697 RepID=A0AAN6Y5V8_9PEZI|nr:hypothetical protein QBC37DRAFT_447729 [Rhypophila decipiens]
MTAEEDPMPQRRHHPYARVRDKRPTYAHDEPLKLLDSSDQTPMDVSDSEMASDDQAGGAMCAGDIDLEMVPPMDEESDDVSIEMDTTSDFVPEYCHPCSKYEELQAQLREKEQELRTLEVRIDSSPFGCVLVDGDGAVFLEEYINQGEKGGKIAGDKLYLGIKNYLESDGELWRLGITKIMVQVYLNVDGLGRALQNAGLLDSHHTDPSRQLTLFGRGFNKAQMLFSFIDVGREKEAADHKIRAVFELMERNLHCKCLILAGCHDGGYGRLLDTYEFKYRCQPPSHKIRLLETTPTPERSVYRTAQYLDAFPRLTLPEVFRSEKVDTSQQVYNGNSWIVPRISYHPWNSSEHFTPQRTPSSGSLYNPPALAVAGTASTSLPRAPETNRHPTGDADLLCSLLSSLDDAATGDVCISTEDDHAATAGRPIKAPSDIVKKDLKNLGHETIKGPDGKVYFTGRERRFCNKYHISGSCPDGHGCKYIHDLRLPKSPLTDKLLTEDGLLTDELLTAIRYNARNPRCGKRWECQDVDCHMGHHCFNPSRCNFPTCKFMDTHTALFDLKPAWKVYHDGRVEEVDRFGPSGQ